MCEKSTETPIQVIESLEFGGDNHETLALEQDELDGLAKNFEQFNFDEVEAAPSAPTAFQLCLLDF